jgi:hypothetical protein
MRFESEEREREWRIRNECFDPFMNMGVCRGFTPLHTALYWGEDFQIALLLKKKKTDVNALDAKGRTPLHIFCMGQCAYNTDQKSLRTRLDTVQLLADYGAVFTAKDDDGKTPLDLLWGPPGIHIEEWMTLKADLMDRFDSQLNHSFKRSRVIVHEEVEVEEEDLEPTEIEDGEDKHGLKRARVVSESEPKIEEAMGEHV